MDARAAGRFRTTRWSVVLDAASADEADSRRALATLCETYWYPLYAYARRRGASAEDAQDLTQGFFAALLEKGTVNVADQERGRFRGFLVTAFRRYMGHEREKAAAEKRGGGRAHLSLDFERGEERYRVEPADDLTPEAVFERRWALTVLDRVLDRLRKEFERTGRGEVFSQVEVFLGGGGPTPTYREVADELGMTVTAIKVVVFRLRKRYRDVLRDEIAQTVTDPDAVDDEIRHLIDALRSRAS